MNRFDTASATAERRKSVIRWLPPLIGILVVLLFIAGVNYVSSTSLDSEQQSLEDAVSRDAVQCYAIEGSYPRDLGYLCEHYGLTYNESRFYVDYQFIGSNIYPDITVIRLSEQEAQ